MHEKRSETASEKEESVRKTITFDKGLWDIIGSADELGTSDSSKVNAICVSWLSEHGILSGAIKKRLGLQ